MLQKHYYCAPDSWQNDRDASAEYSGKTYFPSESTKTQIYQQWCRSDTDDYVAKIWIQTTNFRIFCENF